MTDENGLLADQIRWADRYDGYRRLADGPESLQMLLDPARQEYRGCDRVPDWCGVDLLRGWSFLLARAAAFEDFLRSNNSSRWPEFEAVLRRLAEHPDATPADVPPMRRSSGSAFSTRPRTHANPTVLAAKQRRLWESHVAPVNRLVEKIAASGKGDVPYIDPDSGGVGGKVLFLLEAPARAAAHGSGMLSADNDDGTAAHIWEAYQRSGLPRDWGVHWNAVPWYVGTAERITAVTRAEVEEGRQWLLQLLDLLPDLRVLLAMGVPARRTATALKHELERRGVQLVTTWHPSARNYNSRRHSREEVEAAVAHAYELASGIA
ncbi:MAG: uracil-DNA glycosylase family protein [Motilibacteraceae bacterium]